VKEGYRPQERVILIHHRGETHHIVFNIPVVPEIYGYVYSYIKAAVHGLLKVGIDPVYLNRIHKALENLNKGSLADPVKTGDRGVGKKNVRAVDDPPELIKDNHNIGAVLQKKV
jgi:hypothetical protein